MLAQAVSASGVAALRESGGSLALSPGSTAGPDSTPSPMPAREHLGTALERGHLSPLLPVAPHHRTMRTRGGRFSPRNRIMTSGKAHVPLTRIPTQRRQVTRLLQWHLVRGHAALEIGTRAERRPARRREECDAGAVDLRCRVASCCNAMRDPSSAHRVGIRARNDGLRCTTRVLPAASVSALAVGIGGHSRQGHRVRRGVLQRPGTSS